MKRFFSSTLTNLKRRDNKFLIQKFSKLSPQQVKRDLLSFPEISSLDKGLNRYEQDFIESSDFFLSLMGKMNIKATKREYQPTDEPIIVQYNKIYNYDFTKKPSESVKVYLDLQKIKNKKNFILIANEYYDADNDCLVFSGKEKQALLLIKELFKYQNEVFDEQIDLTRSKQQKVLEFPKEWIQ
ncbi:hypothetical protein HDV01_007539 [Terramyces sp. JEL0728]|nr:hypothetical protein HDV01_007539 [Terramyces sp. JEL0728]